MTDKILAEILKIRDSCAVNMCDVHAVQRIAFDQGMYELVNYIEEDPSRYFHFIVFGKEPVDND